MSTKTHTKSTAVKKEVPKKSATGKKDVTDSPKGAKEAEVKLEKKSAKAKGVEPEIEEVLDSGDVANELESIEEQEDEAAEASGAAGQNSNAAALAAAAAAGGNTEMSASFKNFRHHPDMENFYRFIFENDLRHEALAIIDEIMIDKAQKRQQQVKKH